MQASQGVCENLNQKNLGAHCVNPGTCISKGRILDAFVCLSKVGQDGSLKLIQNWIFISFGAFSSKSPTTFKELMRTTLLHNGCPGIQTPLRHGLATRPK